MGFFPREFMLRKVRHHNFYELADKLESVSLLSLFGGRRKEGNSLSIRSRTFLSVRLKRKRPAV